MAQPTPGAFVKLLQLERCYHELGWFFIGPTAVSPNDDRVRAFLTFRRPPFHTPLVALL